MTIRLAQKKDVDRIMQIISDARESIGRLGIDQWQYGYPTRDIVKEDIELKRGFVAVDGEQIVATFALMLHGEPTYKKIYCGAWIGSGEYIAFHRIAIDSPYRGRGVAEEIIKFLHIYANENGYESIRVDTHTGNIPMRKMLERNGFEYCGTIHLLDGESRAAYEKLTNDTE